LIRKRLDFQCLRQCGSDARKNLANAVDDVKCGRAPRLDHGDEYAAQAIVADDVCLRREALAHMGDIA